MSNRTPPESHHRGRGDVSRVSPVGAGSWLRAMAEANPGYWQTVPGATNTCRVIAFVWDVLFTV